MNLVFRINQTVKGEKGREIKRGATDQEKQPGPRDQETSVAKMAVLYRDRAHIMYPVQLRQSQLFMEVKTHGLNNSPQHSRGSILGQVGLTG